MRAQFFILLLVLCAAPLFAAETPHQEIEYLVTYVKDSNARFIRSGKEYTAQEGAEHIRKELSRAGSRVKTAEDFIDGIATKSFLTGAPYVVKLPEGKTVPTGPG